MSRHQTPNRKLRTAGSAFQMLQLLLDNGGDISSDEFTLALGKLHASDIGLKAAKTRLLTEGMVEIRVAITTHGKARHAFAQQPPLRKKTRCAKSAPTAVKKATAPTGAPIDSTPLAMAWMGRR